MIRKFVFNSIALILLFVSCKQTQVANGLEVEKQALSENDFDKDNSLDKGLDTVLRSINCMDSTFFDKRLRLSSQFHSDDTNEILVIPYSTTQKDFTTEGYSDVKNRIILLNLKGIRDFSTLNALSGDKSLLSVIELVILHEIGHFRLGKEGSFDKRQDNPVTKTTGQQDDDSQPEYLTTLKKIELDADSLAIDLIKSRLKKMGDCTNVCFDIELMLPGMQFNMFGNGIPKNWFKGTAQFLHDPSKDYPNMELRVMFMNYFLFPTAERKQQIDDYLYNRTVAPVHRQEFDPRIFQGQEKNIH